MTYKQFQLSDAEELYQLIKYPEIGYWCGWRTPKNIEDTKQLIKIWNDYPHWYSIILNGKIIGCISLVDVSEDSMELGYWLGRQYRGKGYMSKAIKDMINLAFNKLKIKTLYCGYFRGNFNSKRVQEANGFKYYKQNNVQNLGRFRTEIITKLENGSIR